MPLSKITESKYNKNISLIFEVIALRLNVINFKQFFLNNSITTERYYIEKIIWKMILVKICSQNLTFLSRNFDDSEDDNYRQQKILLIFCDKNYFKLSFSV